MKIMEQREQLGSRLGFILLSAGCAIGIGNVWKFPYMVGQYGGGAFVLIYLFFLVILGIPVMTMEFAMGRAGQRSPARDSSPSSPRPHPSSAIRRGSSSPHRGRLPRRHSLRPMRMPRQGGRSGKMSS